MTSNYRVDNFIVDIECWNSVANVSVDDSEKTKERGLKLIKEEFYELLNCENKQEEVKEIVDLIWVLVGHARSRGLPLKEALREVSDSNWSKFVPLASEMTKEAECDYIESTGQKGVHCVDSHEFTVFKNADSKIVKPSSYKKADISKLFVGEG